MRIPSHRPLVTPTIIARTSLAPPDARVEDLVGIDRFERGGLGALDARAFGKLGTYGANLGPRSLGAAASNAPAMEQITRAALTAVPGVGPVLAGLSAIPGIGPLINRAIAGLTKLVSKIPGVGHLLRAAGKVVGWAKKGVRKLGSFAKTGVKKLGSAVGRGVKKVGKKVGKFFKKIF